MKFPRIVFLIAGIWGLIVTLPLYFAYGFISRRSPPAITHPEFYFAFVGSRWHGSLRFFSLARIRFDFGS